MPIWYYFARPSNLAFHNFTTTKKPPKNLQSLLGLGLKFIPTPPYTHSWSKIKTSTFYRFKRSLHLKFHFASELNEEDDNSNYNPRMYLPSSWTPPPWTWPGGQINDRLHSFETKLSSIFRKKRGKPNLLPHQQRALRQLQSQNDFLVVPCDKNLGPAIIETEEYIRLAFRDHLNHTKTYKRLSTYQATSKANRTKDNINAWITRHKTGLTKMEKKFLSTRLKENNDPFGRFYLTLKAHKLKPGDPISKLKSRPIVSCPGSLLHPLGLWIDSKLQEVAKQQQSYFPNSFELKKQLLELTLPPNARLFTADAVSMYTNIPTNQALNIIRQKLQRYQRDVDETYPADAVSQGLSLVMRNNVFTFGDMTFVQTDGTAMGTPPAPPYSTLYYGDHEDRILPTFADILQFYRRFIDDVFGVYLCHPDPVIDKQRWQALQDEMNKAPGLTWEFSELSHEVNFMDLTIRIKDGRIVTTLYEKPLNLYLYIPPHSAHPPGLLPGIIYGTLFRIYTLCSDDHDRQSRTRVFYKRLQARGYKASNILPTFRRAIERAKAYTGPTTTTEDSTNPVILHLRYHPNDPPSYQIQKAWKETTAEPTYRMPIWNVRNPKTKKKCGIKRMIIAYSRHMNLGNLLSHRNITIDPDQGAAVSSYYQPD